MKNYCSEKFWWMAVNAEKQYVSACCAATPSKIDLEWLKQNPGKLFNTELLQNERQAMLDGRPVPSCYSNCWAPEKLGLPSRRTNSNRQSVTHTNVDAQPELLNLLLNTNCNLTCSYCCKQYSSAWLNDIDKNGVYFDDERFNINAMDRVLVKLGQSTVKNTDGYQAILAELYQHKDVGTLEISGGEPFLFNGLEDVVGHFTGKIVIMTGLGVDTRRLDRVLSKLPADRLTLNISAENTGRLYEFNRYGNSYQHFLSNLAVVKALGITHRFRSVISNLTVFGFKDFVDEYGADNIDANVCTDPLYLSASLLDDVSKEQLNKIDYGVLNNLVKDTINISYSQEEKLKLNKFVIEFARRRNLDLNIFPSSFTNWLNIA